MLRRSYELQAHLLDGQDLTVGTLDTLQLAHKVEEARLGQHNVGGEQLHLEDLGLGISLGGLLAANDNKLVDSHSCSLSTEGKEQPASLNLVTRGTPQMAQP